MPAERPAGSGGSQTPEIVEQLDTAVITLAMLEEEEQLEAAGLERERKMLEKACMSWDRESTEIRYRRLQHLLEKSSIYSKFLLTKMEQRRKKNWREKMSLKVKKGKNSIDASEEKPVMRKKRGREDESYSISEVMSKEEILSVNEDENSSSNICVEDLQKNKESNSIIKGRLSQTVRQNAKFIFDPVQKCNGQPVPFQQPKHFTGGVMRWYQVEGMEWLRMLWENGINGILTVQCIATIALMIERGVPGPFLVCGPLSTLPNWMVEFKRFTPDIPTMLYHGTQEERQKLVRNIHKRQGTLQIYPVVITSFEIAMRDRNALQHCYWKYLIVDEGHRIKNMKCHLIRELKRFSADNKLLLTEVVVYVPLSKKQEIFYTAIVNRTIANMFGSSEKETVQLSPTGRPKRRTRKSINYSKIDDFPNELEKLMSQIQPEVDRERTVVEVNIPVESEVNLKLQNIMMLLCKCCNHPYLIEYPIDRVTQEFKIDEELVINSGKFLILDRMLPELKKKRGHKLLFFSQMTSMLDILMDYCHLRNFNFSRLDGSMSYSERERNMHSFNTDPEVDWNPQSDLQTQDRCHRIGQTKPVVVYRLVTANTIDQKIVERAAAKRKLEKWSIWIKSRKVISDKDLELLLDQSDLIDQMNASGPIKEKMGIFKILENSEDSSPECLF
uniref:Helicase ATP-binding domain-containing protein n=1 Tax=Aotus nancymaae TaxID=37293 RepID=A0A2K5ECZ5_AOTNA